MSEQINGGMACHFSPLEAMFGVVSRGSLGAFVVTFKYVPGEAPAVALLMQAARRLDFGQYGRSHAVDYRTSYAPFVDALNEIDRYDLVFDIKAVVTILADALAKHGTRGSERWDKTVLDALRKKNALLQAQFAVRGDLDDITVSLTLMRRCQEDYDCRIRCKSKPCVAPVLVTVQLSCLLLLVLNGSTPKTNFCSRVG
jgi:hypothetical protein